MMTVKINEGNIVTILTIGSLALLAVLVLGGFIFGSARFAASVLAGGLLALVNFYWLRSVLVRALRLDVRTAPRFAIFRYLARLTFIAVAVYLFIVVCRLDIVGLLIGLSVLVFNIMSLSFYMISAKGD
jgi:ATP synthase I chain